MRKDELRQQIRQIKRQFTPQQLEELSLPIVARLKDRIKDAQTVVAYYPLPDEVDISPLLDELVSAGKTVLLPKVTGDTTMELRRYTGRQNLREGAFGIMDSGVKMCFEPSIWERNSQPSSRNLRMPVNENTWKPPESVRMGRSHVLNL